MYRLRTAAAKRPLRDPNNIFFRGVTATVALLREVTYPQFYSSRSDVWFRTPPVGIILFLLVYLGFVLGLEFVNHSTTGAQYYEALGLRAGWLAIAQLPLLILLASKNNLIGLLVGSSYERLNVFHRWSGRMIWLMATLHWAYQQYGWTVYGVADLEISSDSCYPTGIAAWTIVTWMNVSSIAPLRHWKYEFFVIQHILTWIGFLIAIMYHLPVMYARIYVWIPLGLYAFDRIARTLGLLYYNSRLGRATITALPGGVSKIQVRSSRLSSWKAGQHVFLSLPRFGLFQSHPATILSTPRSHDGELVFLLKAHRGFTSRCHKFATISTTSLIPSKKNESRSDFTSNPSVESAEPRVLQHIAIMSSPYGNAHSDFAAFSSTVLIAGSTGITFTIPLLLEIAERSKTSILPLDSLMFIWIVKSSTWTSWVSTELSTAVADLRAAGITCDIRIFVTCDDALTDTNKTELAPSPMFNQSAISTLPEKGHSKKHAACRCAPTSCQICLCTVNKSSIDDGTRKVTHCHPRPSSSSTNVMESVAAVCTGRPAIGNIIWDVLDAARGETGIAVCGPHALNVTVRQAVARVSDSRGIGKGTGAEGCYLHVEGFGW